LEVGTGSGYLTACLARLGGRVTSAEIFPDLAASAEARLAERGTDNVDVQVADALTLQFEDRFDAIAVTGSLPELNDHFIRMLRPRGRLFVVIGRAPVMEARLITRQSGGQWTELSLFETVLDPLINAEQPEPFVL
jgi:protein-L-isoaspartate(D-aspartate) O-methyltransferase